MGSPRLVVNTGVLRNNIEIMQEAASTAGVALRPHIKAHKSAEIMKLQLIAGAIGITVAKLGEAEVMAEAGATDIFIAYQLMGDDKYSRLTKLRQSARVTVAVDNAEHCRALHAATPHDKPLDVLIEVDSGLARCGVLPQDVLALTRTILTLPSLRFRGIFTHAGHVYGANAQDVARIGIEEAQIMVACADDLRRKGVTVDVVSTGSTPTALHNLTVKGITEIRPGNYVFNDAIQVGLGVVDESRCALFVEARVISTPSPTRVIIDAGSKVFGLDKGAHGMSVVTGFGQVLGWPGLVIERLSEEHGIITCTGPRPELGQRLTIIPNHACVAVNLADSIVSIPDENSWAVSARGRVD
ncbi:MAG: alanine racemase [Bacillota bacterium]|nr:alanine racemase [Bacillota bacterium]